MCLQIAGYLELKYRQDFLTVSIISILFTPFAIFFHIVMREVMYKYGFLFFFVVSLGAQDLTPEEILTYVASHPKPESSITEIRLEVTRKKKKKKKVKVREFTRYEKLYTSGKFTSKSLARFHKPKIVKGTSFLSWVYKNGKTDQWFALPKIKRQKSKSKR